MSAPTLEDVEPRCDLCGALHPHWWLSDDGVPALLCVRCHPDQWDFTAL